jgi:hypothetical protein
MVLLPLALQLPLAHEGMGNYPHACKYPLEKTGMRLPAWILPSG